MSSTGNEDELIANFVAVTDIDSDRARFFLEASGWELQVALASFFEGEQEVDEDAAMRQNVAQPTNVVPGGPDGPEQMSGSQDRHPNLLSQIAQMVEQGTQGSSRPANRAFAPERTGPTTLDSLRARQEDNNSSEDEEDKRQAFYAGGSQSSGQQVLGPPKKRDELVAEMFKKARELGAEDVHSGEPSSTRKKPAGSSSAFGGAGYKLGDEKTSESQRVAPSADSTSQPEESREVVLRLWSTGFTIDDGPIRSFVDPANMEFLNSVKRGEIPRELIRDNHGREVELTMEDRRHEEYVMPKPSSRPFGGVGQMLGSPSPAVVGGTALLTESDREANETAARNLIRLAESEPTTNIQFRLADGTRLVARFNHTHTVNDLHSFINTARPQFSSINYILALLPSTELTEKNVTVKDANLLNAALIQKIK